MGMILSLLMIFLSIILFYKKMKHKLKNFQFTLNKKIPVDKFLQKAMYEPRIGYYNNRIPFGKDGDFVTSPTISNLFSEILAIWIISVWEKFEKPKIFNLVELGPGDGSLAKILIQTFKNFLNLINL